MTDQIIFVVTFGFAFFSIWLSYSVWKLGNEVDQQSPRAGAEREAYAERDIDVESDADLEAGIYVGRNIALEPDISETLAQTGLEIDRIQSLVGRLASSDIYSPAATRLSESLGAQRALLENLRGIERARSAAGPIGLEVAETDIDPEA
jgi:hypothetical protein